MTDRVLVTGITGRIGANLAKRLLDQGYQVRGLVMTNDPKVAKLSGLSVEIMYGDLTDLVNLRLAVKGADIVVDLAAMIGCPQGMDMATYFNINVDGKFNLMEAIAADGHVKRVVHASSVAAYSSFNALYTPTDENHPLRPFFPYGNVKALAESTVWNQSLQHGIPTTVLRYGHVDAGEEALGCYTARFIADQLRSYAANRCSSLHVEGVEAPWSIVESATDSQHQLTIPRGAGGRTWLWRPCDVRDAVEGTIRAMESPSAVGEAFNIEGPRAVTWEEAVKYTARKLGQSYAEVELPNIWHFETTITKAQRLLGYYPRYDVFQMVDSAFEVQQGKDIGVLPP